MFKILSEGTTLPLFPLSSMVFPRSRMPLRLFEQRYLDMLKRCLKQEEGFVVMLLREGSELRPFARDTQPNVYAVGVYVEVVDWDAREDGCLGITIEGRQRVSLGSDISVGEDGLYSARVNPLQDIEADLLPVQWPSLVDVASELLKHPVLASLQLELDRNDPLQVSSVLGQWLPISSEQRMSLLESDSIQGRLERLLEYLAELA